MKLKSLLVAALSVTAFGANAQHTNWIADTITMANNGGTTFANDVFYRMDYNGARKTEPNDNWHIAFVGGAGGRSAAVLGNGAGAGVNVYVLSVAANAKFGTDLTADTVGKKSTPLYNDITTWQVGAFNANGAGHPDYGWGVYDALTHNLSGNKVYLVTTPGGDYQVWIEEQIANVGPAMGWKFHVADIDGSNRKDEQILIQSGGYANKLFAYYNIETKTVLDREPDNHQWDLLFTRYMDEAAPGMMYPYTGILNNTEVIITELRDIDADTANFHDDYLLDDEANIVGRDWKQNGAPVGTDYLLNKVCWFIQSRNNSIYEMEITYATTGAGGAKIGFRKRLAVWNNPPLSVNNVATTNNKLNIYPNPATNATNLLITAEKAGNVQVLITDVTGKVVKHNQVNLNAGLNALKVNTNELSNGMYIVTVANGNWKIAEKLSVQH
jgi:hypothetical protein